MLSLSGVFLSCSRALDTLALSSVPLADTLSLSISIHEANTIEKLHLRNYFYYFHIVSCYVVCTVEKLATNLFVYKESKD